MSADVILLQVDPQANGGWQSPIGTFGYSFATGKLYFKNGDSPTAWMVMASTPFPQALQTTWYVDPQNTAASDSNSGSSASPLKTLTEVAKRLTGVVIPSGTLVTINLLSDCVSTDTPVWIYTVKNGTQNDGIQIVGTPSAPIYTGTVTSYTAQATGNNASATDNVLGDTTIPVSFTASGITGTGLIYKRTNSTPLYWFPLKDKGSQTLRITDPLSVSTATPNLLGAGTITNLATNDTYTVSKLPKIYEQRVSNGDMTRGVCPGKFVMSFVDDNSATQSAGAYQLSSITYDRSTISTQHTWCSVNLLNSMVNASLCQLQGGQSCWRGGGMVTANGFFTVSLGAFLTGSSNGPPHFETTQFGVGTGGVASMGVLCFYDNTADCLQVARGGYCGINSIKGVGMGSSSFLIHVIAPGIVQAAGNVLTVDASSSNATPIKVAGTTMASASLPYTTNFATTGGMVVNQV